MYTADASRWPSTPAGSSSDECAAIAISAMPRAWSGSPRTRHLPSCQSRSSADTSSMAAATSRARSRTLLRGDHGRGAGHRGGPRAVGAEAERRPVGVAVHHLDVVRRQAQLVGDQLRERGLVALALGLHGDREHRLPGRVHPQVGAVGHAQAEDVHLAARAGPDRLGEEAQPDAHVLAAGPPLGLLAAQLVVARHVQGQPQRPRVVA